MNQDDFTDQAPGRLTFAADGVAAFVPNPLPPTLTLEPTTVTWLGAAEREVGRLAGIFSGNEFNPYLVGALLRREALLSSRLEGTVTTPEKLAVREAASLLTRLQFDDPTQEVLNYVSAMDRGLELVSAGHPVTLNVIRELHGTLMRDVRGGTERPGEFRTTQNWITRNDDDSIENARYVPPPIVEMNECLGAFERYLNQEPEREGPPYLIWLALIHYQFEAIHPFRDGNGRVGRLLIPLLMCGHGYLESPTLYLSAFLEDRANRGAYVDLMLQVSQRGDWISWVNFFLSAVAESARDAISGVVAATELRNQYYERVAEPGASIVMRNLVDLLFRNPAISTKRVVEELGVPAHTARYSIKKLESAGLLREVTRGKKNLIYVADEVLEIMERPRG